MTDPQNPERSASELLAADTTAPVAPVAPVQETPTPEAPTAPTAPTFPMQPPFSNAAPTAPQAPLFGATPAPETARRPHPAQFGTIVWGMLLIALCGFVGLTQFGPGVDADRYLWAFIGVIAVGVALVAVGIVAAVRR